MKYLLLIMTMLVSAVTAVSAEQKDSITAEWVRQHYEKREVMITMRDGVRLFTAIYQPKDKSVMRPVIMQRSCYSASPYGEDKFMGLERPAWREFTRNGYIFVFQDVRGKNYSEGEFADIRPFVEGKKRPKYNKNGEVVVNAAAPIDEASDTYDTAEWLVHNTASNGNIGVFGISYPGFYTTMAALSGHPAIKAVSPQAPVTDWFRGDDAHHNGAFMLADMFSFQYWFEYRNVKSYWQAASEGRRPLVGKNPSDIVHRDLYHDYLQMGAVKHFTALLGDSVQGWKDVVEHPDLDQWWEDRNVLYHCKNVCPAVMIVGGLFDAEDCYGAFATYRQIRKDSPKTDLYLVEGPWAHGMWSRGATDFFGDIFYGKEQCSDYYLKNIEYPFFAYYLEGKGEKPSARARVFDSGSASWRYYRDGWPEVKEQKTYYLTASGMRDKLSRSIMHPVTYVSDPEHPVPYVMKPGASRTTTYMLDDQRFASTRSDVAVFEGGVLTDTLQLLGPVEAELVVSTTGTDCDFIVKLIDVYPDDFQYPDSIVALSGRRYADMPLMSGYQMLVRGEVMRGKYRNSLSHPEPFTPGEPTTVRFTLPDVAHTFLPGHRLMVQVQSTWFPLVDRNPQQFCNIYECDDLDFQKATISIYPQSKVLLPVR